MKKLFSTLFVVLFATSMMAQTGFTCDDPIPVDSNYQGYVSGPCEIWYTANTYDLPLNVYFLPDAEGSTWGPEVFIDFTCEPGVYDDPNIENLVNSVSGFGYDLPIELLCDQVVREGRNAYDLNVGKFYRDQLTEFGINYNVQAFVRVQFFESGVVSFRPDTLFRNCMENSHYIELGDTLDILANDSNRVFVAALPDWKNDSIRFVWEGTDPLRMFFATTECSFIPTTTNDYVYKYYDVEAGTPLKMYSEQMKLDIDNSKDGGIFYVKMLAPTSGRLIIEKIPMDPPAGGAELLEYDKSVSVASGDLFAMPKSWKKATEFIASSKMEMQVSNSHLFDAATSGVFVNTYSSLLDDGIYSVGLTSSEMRTLTEDALDSYLYVRFVAPSSLTVTPRYWEISECLDNTQLLSPNVALYISSSTSANVYRIAYADFKGYDMQIKWEGNGRMTTYVGDTCIFSMETTDPHVIFSKAFSRKGTSTVAADVVNSWENSVDEEGYLYVRFSPGTSSRVTLVTEKPAAPDPVYTSFDAAVCFGETYEWNGQTYNETGKYTQTFPAANGADSIVTLNLTVLPEVPVTKEIAAVCYGETYTWQGQEYTESGEYSVTLQDVNGCDSVITLAFTVYPQTPDTTEKVEIPFGETYEWNGIVYAESGEYTATLQDENGCNYQATLVLTVLPEEKPEEDGTILLNPTDELVLNLDSAVNVYRTDYDVWSASKVQLDWYGDKPLHVFVSKEKDFFVAIYHEDVVLYQKIDAVDPTSVEPQVLVLDMSALRAHVNDGKLYVRFLTDSDARLVIEPLTE